MSTEAGRAANVGRLLSVAVLGTLLTGALVGAEVWPMSSFELFSRVRTGERVSVEVVATRADGSVTAVAIDELTAHDPAATEVLSELVRRPVDEQQDVLGGFVRAAGIDDAVTARVARVTRVFDLSADGSTHVVRSTTLLEITDLPDTTE